MKKMTVPPEKPQVRHNPVLHRFEMHAEDHTAVLEYIRQDDTIVFTRTVVPGELEGRGIGSHLAHAALEFARDKSLKVVPTCWFVTGFIERHPEYQNLLR